ncbi:MAG: cell division protein FtsA [Candidatus Shapirobacteria bacterium]|nr:cell division protein FtsA [Candidatus Shapirobacteria bacterium]
MQHSKTISGIDIGTSKVTTIIGQYLETEDKFNIIAVSSIPALGFRKGQIINIEQASNTITQSIESAERMAGFQVNSASISISAPYIESTNSHGVIAISNPNGEIDSTDIDRVIEAAKAIAIPPGKEIIHIIPIKYTVDGQEGVIDPIGMNGIRLEVETHIILASSPSLKNLKKCLEDIGIHINDLVFSGLAASRATLTETEKELGVALIDIGGSITTITVFNEGAPIFSSVIPIGANNVTNDLAIGLRFSLENAEKIKLRLSKLIENKNFEDEIELSKFDIDTDDKNRKISIQNATNGIIKPRLEEIFNLIYSQLEDVNLQHVIPAGIVLTGGGSQTVNIKEICEKIIPLPLRIASPPKMGGIVDDILNPAYTSTIGLLMFTRENKANNSSSQTKKIKINFGGLFGRFKKLIEPILP